MKKDKNNYAVYKRGAKIVFHLLQPNRREVAFLILLAIINSILTATAPYILGKVYDSILTPVVIWFLFGWFAIQGIAYGAERVSSNLNAKLGTTLYNRYVTNAWSSLLTFPMSFHKRRRTGAITSTVSRAGNSLDNIVNQWVINLIPQTLTIVFALAISFYLNTRLALIIVVGLVIYCFVLFKNLTTTTKLQEKNIATWSKAHDISYEVVEHVATIKQAATEEDESKRIKQSYHKAGINDVFLSIFNNSLVTWQRVVISVTQLVVIGVGIVMIRQGQITLGNLIAFVGYVGLSFGPFINLSTWWRWVQGGLVTLDRANKIMTANPESYNGIIPQDTLKGRVEFKNVFFHYEEKKSVLKGISFIVNPGETVALVGESGVGKSTTIDLLGGYFFPQKGEVLVDGVSNKKLSLHWLRSNIAVVPQEPVLFNTTIFNNLRYGSPKASDELVKKSAQLAHATDFINKFPKQWKQMVGERGVKLSVGQKQRVAIARAILRDPKILILDEPTSALDAASETVIQESLKELMRGRTTFIIAHRLSTVRRADKILVFKDGQIVEEGKHETLIKKVGGTYRRLYELQIGLHK